jgi:hypothetical protein
MKQTMAVVFFVSVACAASRGENGNSATAVRDPAQVSPGFAIESVEDGTGYVRLDPPRPPPQYLNTSQVAQLIPLLAKIPYPASRDEIFKILGMTGRNLPELGVGGKSVAAASPTGGNAYAQLDLTDPRDTHQRYYLYLWYQPDYGKFAGPKFSRSPVVGYVEIILTDLDLRTTFVAQSNRYPSANLNYANRILRKN